MLTICNVCLPSVVVDMHLEGVEQGLIVVLDVPGSKFLDYIKEVSSSDSHKLSIVKRREELFIICCSSVGNVVSVGVVGHVVRVGFNMMKVGGIRHMGCNRL